MGGILDLGYLERLCKGDRSRMAEYVFLYLEEAPKLFARLEAMLARGDAEQLARAAHGLYPQAHYLGAERLCGLLTEVEKGARTEGALACTAAVSRCSELNEELMRALRNWREEGCR